jgi:hypothetical protein
LSDNCSVYTDSEQPTASARGRGCCPSRNDEVFHSPLGCHVLAIMQSLEVASAVYPLIRTFFIEHFIDKYLDKTKFSTNTNRRCPKCAGLRRIRFRSNGQVRTACTAAIQFAIAILEGSEAPRRIVLTTSVPGKAGRGSLCNEFSSSEASGSTSIILTTSVPEKVRRE